MIENTQSAANENDQSAPPIPRKAIAGCTAAALGYSLAEVCGHRRSRNLVLARYVAIHLIREMHPRASLPEIAQTMGDRDHTTIIHALARASGLLIESQSFRDMVDAARARIASWRPGMTADAGFGLVVVRHPQPRKRRPAVKFSAFVAPSGVKVPTKGWAHDDTVLDWFAANDRRFRLGMQAAHPERFGATHEAAE